MLTMYRHQKTMLEYLTNNRRFLLLAEAGAGKTWPCLLHMTNLLMAGEIEDALVVAPLSGLEAWHRDAELLSDERQRLFRERVRLVNYDKLSRKDGRYQRECWKPWGALFLDEGHAIANPTSNRTKYFVGAGKKAGLGDMATHVYDITGTLLNNSRLEDAWAPLRLMLGSQWEYYLWSDFKRHFLVTKTLPGSYADIVVGYRHRAELLELLGRFSYRVLLKDCLDLPPVLPDEIITVPWKGGKNVEPFHKSTKELYEDALDSYVEALDMVMDNPLTRRLRIRQVASGHIKESDTIDDNGRKVAGEMYHLKNNKIPYLMELIEDNLPNKTVIGYQFRATGAAVVAALKKAGVNHLVLNGDTKDKSVWRTFQADDSIKVFVVQYASGSEAIDLFSASRTILMEPMDSSRTCIQFRNRTNRNGQTRPCSYVWLLTEGSIEFDMYERLKSHRDFDDSCWKEVAERRRQMRGEK